MKFEDLKNYNEFTPFSFRVLNFKQVGSDNKVYWKKHPFWYVYTNEWKTITFEDGVLGGIYILKVKIESGSRLYLPNNIRYPTGFTFGNKEGISYLQFLYTTEDYTHYYFDLIGAIEGLKTI